MKQMKQIKQIKQMKQLKQKLYLLFFVEKAVYSVLTKQIVSNVKVDMRKQFYKITKLNVNKRSYLMF